MRLSLSRALHVAYHVPFIRGYSLLLHTGFVLFCYDVRICKFQRLQKWS
jgi:hypothetical protein